IAPSRSSGERTGRPEVRRTTSRRDRAPPGTANDPEERKSSMSEMSNDQVEREPEKYGSKFAQMFGYIRPEDRARWSQLRAENQKKVSTTRQTAKLSSASMLDFGNRNINAKLMAAHRVAEQEKFDTTHAKTVTQDMDRSEERRVGKERRHRRLAEHAEKEADSSYAR